MKMLLILVLLFSKLIIAKNSKSFSLPTDLEFYSKVCQNNPYLTVNSLSDLNKVKQGLILEQLNRFSETTYQKNFAEVFKDFLDFYKLKLSDEKETDTLPKLEIYIAKEFFKEGRSIENSLELALNSEKTFNALKTKIENKQDIPRIEVEAYLAQVKSDFLELANKGPEFLLKANSSKCFNDENKTLPICQDLKQYKYSTIKNQESDKAIIEKYFSESYDFMITKEPDLFALTQLLASETAQTFPYTKLGSYFYFYSGFSTYKYDYINTVYDKFVNSIRSSSNYINLSLSNLFYQPIFQKVVAHVEELKTMYLNHLKKINITANQDLNEIYNQIAKIELVYVPKLAEGSVLKNSKTSYYFASWLVGDFGSEYQIFDAYYLDPYMHSMMFDSTKNEDKINVGWGFLEMAKKDIHSIDLVVLHELSHKLGLNVSRLNHYANQTQNLFHSVWDCLAENFASSLGTDESFADWFALEVYADYHSKQDLAQYKDNVLKVIAPFCLMASLDMGGSRLDSHPDTILRIEDLLGSHPSMFTTFNLRDEKKYCEQ